MIFADEFGQVVDVFVGFAGDIDAIIAEKIFA